MKRGSNLRLRRRGCHYRGWGRQGKNSDLVTTAAAGPAQQPRACCHRGGEQRRADRHNGANMSNQPPQGADVDFPSVAPEPIFYQNTRHNRQRTPWRTHRQQTRQHILERSGPTNRSWASISRENHIEQTLFAEIRLTPRVAQ